VFGLDEKLASFSDGTTLAVVVLVAIVLGLRHATDPDHLAAVTTLIASGKERAARTACVLGFTWGLGHATSLFAFGLPIVLYRTYLPERVQAGAETSVAVVIVVLALWLLVRWRRGSFESVAHAHGGGRHLHGPGLDHPAKTRSRPQAYGIGLLHGMGGSAGVGVLLLANIGDRALSVAALGLFAIFTALSMGLLSCGLGLTLSATGVRRAFNHLAPVLGVASLAFGIWYGLGAQGLLPYYF
jgi:ABC-type nickel/cobalt efflux system permease component RcnA